MASTTSSDGATHALVLTDHGWEVHPLGAGTLRVGDAVVSGGDAPALVHRDGRRVRLRTGETVRAAGVTIALVRGWPEPGGARVAAPPGPPRVVAEDPSMAATVGMARDVADSDLSVLLLGETGAGKDVLAELIHASSPRRAQPLVKLNCAALSPALIESELFGHERGAFTGAVEARAGLFEAAHGGTLFLDELGELPLALEAKLLRALESRTIRRVGGVASIPIDVRFVSATNRDLRAEVAHGRFRADLYYRIAAATIVVPPLRARPGDLEPLTRSVLGELCRRSQRPVPVVSEAALARLRAHPWPGNVRELRNVLERALALHRGPVLCAEHLLIEPVAPVARAAPPSAGLVAPGLGERERILAALEFTGGNQGSAARLLNMSRRTLLKRLDAYQLPRPRKGRRRPPD